MYDNFFYILTIPLKSKDDIIFFENAAYNLWNCSGLTGILAGYCEKYFHDLSVLQFHQKISLANFKKYCFTIFY